jgi:hypothetical protein
MTLLTREEEEILHGVRALSRDLEPRVRHIEAQLALIELMCLEILRDVHKRTVYSAPAGFGFQACASSSS